MNPPNEEELKRIKGAIKALASSNWYFPTGTGLYLDMIADELTVERGHRIIDYEMQWRFETGWREVT